MFDAKIQAWLDQEDAKVTDKIRRHGWMVQFVGGSGPCGCPECGGDEDDSNPPFAYTVGLFGLGHPELVVVGLPPGTAAGVLNSLGAQVKAGGTLVPGVLLTLPQWPHRIVAEAIPNPGEIVLGANRHYRRPPEASVPALQLSYDDVDGRFPWEAGYAAPELQPRPGTWRA